MFLRSRTARRSRFGLRPRHDPGLDVVVEREDRDRRTTDGETRRCHDRRHQPFEALAAFRQLGRHARRAGMDLGTDMMGDQANDALGVGRRDPVAGILEAAGKAVDPEPAVGIEHDLDDARIFQMSGDQRAERGAQHARAARDGF